mgnify:CR=1 FL=1
MVRTQVQIDEPTYEKLRETAHRQRKSMSAVVREILHEHLESGTKSRGIADKDFHFIGIGTSGRTDISVKHDEALAEDFR